MKNFVVTILGKDAPGIIADITCVFAKYRANLEDINMAILGNEFAMIMVVKTDGKKIEKIKQTASNILAKRKLIAYWKPINGCDNGAKRRKNKTVRYIVSAIGKDKVGIVYRTSSLFSKYKFNITDLTCKKLGTKKRAIYSLLLEVNILCSFNIKILKAKLNTLKKILKVDFSIQRVETFNA